MICTRTVILVAVTLAGFFLNEQSTLACSCAGKPTILDAYSWAQVVVVAQVVSVDKVDSPQTGSQSVTSTKMIVERVFKGPIKSGEEMVFPQGGGGSCSWGFSEKEIGKRFLFYLPERTSGGLWYASACGRSTILESAADDLLYLENESKVRGKTRLSGTLSLYRPSAIEGESPIYRPLDALTVLIVGEKKSYNLKTNASGVFELYDLPAGKYLVQPEIPDGWKIDSPRANQERRAKTAGVSQGDGFEVTVVEGKHSFIDFSYGVNNAIRGTVLDTSGNAMKDVCLDILPAVGKPAPYFRAFDCTDAVGRFEINGIPPGRYVIVVNKDGKVSSAEPFRRFYYPNVVEQEKAEVIQITAGQRVEGIIVTVPSMEETITIEGVLVYDDGKPVVDESVEFKPDSTPDGIDGSATAETDSSGRFSIRILKGLKGKLYSEMWAYAGKFLNCPKVDALLKDNNRGKNIQTNRVNLEAVADSSKVVLRFPFPDCEKSR